MVTDTNADVSGVLEQLRRRYRSRATRDVGWRVEQLTGIECLVAEQEGELVKALAHDLRRAPDEAWLGDLATTASEARYARRHVKTWMRTRHVRLNLNTWPGKGWYQFEPHGVALIIGPWNYPIYLTLGPLVGAVAAGNCAVVKPSEYAAATSELLAQLIPQYLDPEAVAVVQGGPETVISLVDTGVDQVFFTGGAKAGRQVAAAAAARLTPVTLELGGKCPVIVTSRADVAVAARRIIWTKIVNSGQTCIAPDYVLVDVSVREQLMQQLRLAASTMIPFEVSEGLPIVNETHTRRLQHLLENHQGTVAIGGTCDVASRTVQFTIIADPAADSAVMREEIFGPILPVIGIRHLDEAVTYINGRPKPLAAYVFSGDRAEQNRVVSEIESGGVVINHIAFHCLAPQLPFGGIGSSGMGTYHGEHGFETFSHRRAVLRKPARPDLRFVYPPYGQTTRRLLRKLF